MDLPTFDAPPIMESSVGFHQVMIFPMLCFQLDINTGKWWWQHRPMGHEPMYPNLRMATQITDEVAIATLSLMPYVTKDVVL